MTQTSTPDRRIFEFGTFRLDVPEHTVWRAEGPPVQLTPRLLGTLVFLLEHPGQLVSKRMLIDAVWKGVVVEENSLSQSISALRRALVEGAHPCQCIETVSGSGYRFLLPVKVSVPREPAATHRAASIAVLAFDDLSPEGNQEYLADGIAEEILNRLTQIRGLRVIGRASSFFFRGHVQRPRVIAAELGAEYLLTGSVCKDGTRLRVTAQLMEAESEVQSWAARFDREPADIFAVRDDIAGAVASAVCHGIDVPAASSGETDSLEAHDRYLRARAATRQMGPQGMARAITLYREALTIDAGFVLAWLGLVEACRGILVFAPNVVPDARQMLDEAADRAVALAPNFWASHVAATWRLGLEHDWDGFEHALSRATALTGGRPVDLDFAWTIFFAHVGRIPEATERARGVSRNDPLSLLASNVYQMLLHTLGRDDECEAEYQRSLDLPGSRDVPEHVALHRAWMQREPHLTAERFSRYLEHQSVPLPVLHQVFEVRESPARALQLLRAATHEPIAQGATPQMILAWWLSHYGDPEAALACARRAMLEFQGAPTSWLWFPVLREARRLPAFKSLVTSLRLPDYWRETGRWGDFARPTQNGNFELL